MEDILYAKKASLREGIDENGGRKTR